MSNVVERQFSSQAENCSARCWTVVDSTLLGNQGPHLRARHLVQQKPAVGLVFRVYFENFWTVFNVPVVVLCETPP